MREILNLSNNRFEILGESEAILEFRDAPTAVSFLRGLSKDPANRQLLRNLLSERSPGIHRLSDEAVLQQLATLLLRREIRILRSMPARSLRPAAEIEEEKTGKNAAAPPQQKKSWIEIRLRDMEGQSVPRKRFRIRMPDASIREGTLDDFGNAEFSDINDGICQITFLDYDAEAWEIA